MATTVEEEGWHSLPDGTKLYTKTWKPSSPPSALLVFIHGFSDHSNTHSFFFTALAARSIQTFAFDQRGWGRSASTRAMRGQTGSTARVLADMTSVLRALLAPAHGAPVFVMGHSMGGAQVLHYAARGPEDVRRQIAGYVVESPWIVLDKATQPNRAVVLAGKLAARVLPRWQLVQAPDDKWVSRDQEEVRRIMEDELCHRTGTLEGFAGCFARAAELDGGALVLHDGEGEGNECRLWLGHGTADQITSFEASERFMKRLSLKDMEFKVYDGWYHKLHSEPGEDKRIFTNDVADWVLARASIAGEQRPDDPPAKSKL